MGQEDVIDGSDGHDLYPGMEDQSSPVIHGKTQVPKCLLHHIVVFVFLLSFIPVSSSLKSFEKCWKQDSNSNTLSRLN